jgi:hypothetical protein
MTKIAGFFILRKVVTVVFMLSVGRLKMAGVACLYKSPADYKR